MKDLGTLGNSCHSLLTSFEPHAESQTGRLLRRLNIRFSAGQFQNMPFADSSNDTQQLTSYHTTARGTVHLSFVLGGFVLVLRASQED
jgi:hypothetical protein